MDRSLLKDPVTLKAFREAVSENVERLRGSTIDGRQATSLQVLEGAMVAAAKQVLMSDGRRRPGWFVAAKATLGPEIAVRNQMTKAYGANPGDEAKKALKVARKRVKRAIVLAKESWMELVVDTINGKESTEERRPVTPPDI